MAHETGETVTISIHRPSDTPSVFIAGTFSDPAWEPLELTPKVAEAAEEDSDNKSAGYVFSREFQIPQGKYQYRFRLDEADSWFHDDKTETGESPEIFPRLVHQTENSQLQ
jgi:hypothetical protein